MVLMTVLMATTFGAVAQTSISSLYAMSGDLDGNYVIEDDIDASSFSSSLGTFTGTLTATAKSDGTFPVITGLTKPIFKKATDATISNIMLKSVTISDDGCVGAICDTANGTTRIYNCGILPTTNDHPDNATRSTVTSNNNHCGSLVGYLDGYARVINCFSYANVSAGTSENIYAGGLVGYNTTATMQGNDETNFKKNCKTMVVNCMFYGDIKQGNIKRPVYGGTAIANDKADRTNNYNYYCQDEASFEGGLNTFAKYNYSWPVAKKYLVRFEVYRNILNSNRRLCTWWVNGAYNTCPTDADVESVGIAKWVLDQTIAPYPILKKWGKYYSTFDIDPDYVWNPKTKSKVARGNANPWEGKSESTPIAVTINGGSNNSSASTSMNLIVTDMDTLGYDYCARKIQLPYYNEVFGAPNGATWAAKYANNYTGKVVTGWKITAVNNNDQGGDYSFDDYWESGCNYANRSDKYKDLYAKSGRVFAQGGYYYVPDGVTSITIEAYWGNAVYLCNPSNYLDRVNNGSNDFYNSGALSFGGSGGILPLWPTTNVLKTSLSNAVGALTQNASWTVYDQAIVLVGNYQNNAFHNDIILNCNNESQYSSRAKPFTIMSADFDFDNEPDFCFQAGSYNGGRINCQPIRFDFLVVPDITMAIRANTSYFGIRIWTPIGHFEVTETSYQYTTQFEYDTRNDNNRVKHEAPVILNGGEHMQIVSSEAYTTTNNNATATARVEKTSYFLMGGKVYMHAFSPGCHGNKNIGTRHCAINAIGGEFPKLYLSGMFNANFYNMTDNPHCYIDGGKFGLIAGAGMESVGGKNETNGGNVTFIINHSLIKEFYGGGINAQRPVTGNITVTIDNSFVHKYCGGPKVGDMSSSKRIETTATNTVFGQYYGGGNGGTNLLRDRQYDAGAGVSAPTQTDHSHWDKDAKFSAFTPFSYDASKGYQAEYEFEMLPRTSGNGNVITRSYYHWASFAKTTVAPVTNKITDCTFKGNFYGGGNLGAVGGDITSTLDGNTIVYGSAFGAGYSADIPSFPVHDKSSVSYPYRDASGFLHDGSLDYNQYTADMTLGSDHAVGDTIYYQWTNNQPAGVSTSAPTFQDENGNWYCYTETPLINLGAVTGNVTLTIKGKTIVGTIEDGNLKAGTGNVYGGGDESAVIKNGSGEKGNATVILEEGATVYGNVYGGGNEGPVGGNSEVIIQDN